MRKRIYNDNGDIISIEFKDIDDLIKYISIPELLQRSKSSMGTEVDWYGTNSLQEATRFCKSGWEEGFKNFLETKKQLSVIKPEVYMKENPEIGRFGFLPHVSNYLKGLPNNMYYNEESEEENLVTVYVNGSYSHFTRNNQVKNRGIITLCIVEILEQLGYKVKINLYELAYSNNQKLFITIPIKEPEEFVNYKKVYFPLCNPSFLRRIIFRIEESISELEQEWYNGYGMPMNYRTTRKFLKLKDTDLLITNPTSMGIDGDNIILDSISAFKIMNLESYFTAKDDIEKVSFPLDLRNENKQYKK